MQKTNTLNKTFSSIVLITFLLSFGYAVLRYNVMGPVPWKDVPFFILNKGISLSAFILLTIGFSLNPLTNLGFRVSLKLLNTRSALGMIGFLLSLIHILMSFMILNPAVFKKFFLSNGSLSFTAGLSMLGGVLSFVILWCYNLSLQERIKENKTFNQFISSKRFILMTLFFVGVHLFFMGYRGWLIPAEWYGGLPPISLLSFIFFALGFIINIFGRK